MKTLIVVLFFIVLSCYFANAVLADVGSAVSKIEEGFAGQIVTAAGSDPSDRMHEFIGEIIKTLLGIMGSVSLCIFIYGGIMWMTAGGKEQNITKAQDTMIWAALGLFAIFCSYMIVKYVITALTF